MLNANPLNPGRFLHVTSAQLAVTADISPVRDPAVNVAFIGVRYKVMERVLTCFKCRKRVLPAEQTQGGHMHLEIASDDAASLIETYLSRAAKAISRQKAVPDEPSGV